MKRNAGLLFSAGALVLGVSVPVDALAQAKCDIADVVFMVKKERLKPEQIRRECNSVKNAGSCSVTAVIRLADSGRDEDEIAEECGPRSRQQSMPSNDSGGGRRVATMCMTPAGSCPMAIAIPVGATCNCSGPWGIYWGQAR